MTASYIQNQFADRLGGDQFGKDTKIYKFEKIKRAKRAALEANPDKELFDMGVGEPDAMADPGVVKVLQQEAEKPENRGYTDNGIEEFKIAAVRYMEKTFGIQGLDPQKHVNHSIGSKPALAMTPQVFINPGDITLMTTPGYPVMGTHTQYLGGEVVNLPLTEENNFLPDLKSIDSATAKKAKLLYLNYPNNPTTATADLDFFKRVVEFGRQHNILIAHDSAYSENTYDGYKAPSILEVDGADEVAVEFFSLSKGFNMTGWRLGFVVGNVSALAALDKVKNNIDNGSLRALQFAGAKALSVVDEIIPPINAVYKRRRDMVVDGLNSNGWSLEKPKATIYIWAPVPDGYNGQSTEFATELLEKSGVVVTPGLLYGQWGEGYFRISLTYPDEVIQEAISRLAEMRL